MSTAVVGNSTEAATVALTTPPVIKVRDEVP